jgi:hypothetical protein
VVLASDLLRGLVVVACAVASLEAVAQNEDLL